MKNILENRRKRLLYQSDHRGMRELDIVIGNYAKSHLPQMNASDMDALETLLSEPEHFLYTWLMGHEDPPQHYADLITSMKNHKN